MALLFALGSWWYLLAQRLTNDYFGLLREKILSSAGEQAKIAEGLQQLDQKIDRRMLMLTGEVSFFFFLLVICIAVLFVVARQRRRAFEHMERMLQMTTHELKTPIAGVKALLQSLQLGSIPAASVKRILEQGVSECDRLEHLTEGLLAYQRALARVRHKPEVCAPGQLIGDVLEARTRTFGDESIVAKLDAAQTPVIADRDAFRVILENLIDNAKKYGEHKPIEVTGMLAGDRYAVRVTDRGIGFEPSFAAQLFAPFERGEAEKRGMQGSGLGLYIARSLAEGLGGGLTAESAGAGRGSTFTVSLRIAEGAQRT